MKSSHDISQAIGLLKQTLPEMQRRQIATTPENYAVWYEYVSGDNPNLVNEINLLDTNRTAFTAELHRDLYQRYVASEREASVNKLSDTVKDLIHNFLIKSKNEEEGLGRYSTALNQISSEFETLEGIAEVKLMVAQLIDHTQQRESAVNEMQSSLETMSSEMQRLRAEVSRLSGESSIDALTKIASRVAFDSDLDTYAALSASEGTPLPIILLNVDNFSVFNERYGTAIGDKVLKFIATLFKRNLKGNDLLARFSDDAFIILLPETDLDGALTVAENLRERLSKQTLSDSAEKMQLGTITVSGGVTLYKNGETTDACIERAKVALSRSKFEGKNRISHV
jgi:diguanylate cyclase